MLEELENDAIGATFFVLAKLLVKMKQSETIWINMSLHLFLRFP